MNIFVTSPDPVICAANLDDKRVVKMTLETCQMLSTAVTERGGEGWYKPTHANHPCSIWVRENWQNYSWTLIHFEALIHEYERRYERVHKCIDYLGIARRSIGLMPGDPMTQQTPFADCSCVDPEYQPDSIFARYRECLRLKFEADKRPPTWYRVGLPELLDPSGNIRWGEMRQAVLES